MSERKYVSVRMNHDDYVTLVQLRNNEKENIIKHSAITDYISYMINQYIILQEDSHEPH